MKIRFQQIIMSAVLVLVSFAYTNVYAADCATYLFSLPGLSNANRGELTAVQIAFNKSRGESGHFSLADGYLTPYNPDEYPDIAALINRDLPLLGSVQGVFAPIPKFIMDGFEFDNGRSSHTRDREFPNARRDEMSVVLLRNGEVFIVLHSWNNTVLRVDDLQCSHDEFADLYMTGIMREVNGTSVVSFIFNRSFH